MDQQKNLYLSAIDEGKNIATSLHLKIALNETVLCETSLMEKNFLHQFNGHVVRKGTPLVLKLFGRKWQVIVKKITESDSVNGELSTEMKSLSLNTDVPHVYSLILSTTKIYWVQPNEISSGLVDPVGLSDFGGSHEVVEEITKLCTNVFSESTTPSKSNFIFNHQIYLCYQQNLIGRGPRGLLIYGPPGTGKSLLVRATAGHFKVPLVTIQGPELFSKYYGETEARLREKFEEAIKKYNLSSSNAIFV